MDKDEKISIKIVDIYDFQKQNNLRIRFTKKNGSLKTEWLTAKIVARKKARSTLEVNTIIRAKYQLMRI